MKAFTTIVILALLAWWAYLFSQKSNSGEGFSTQSVSVDQWYDLALTKKVDPSSQAPFYPGDEVTFIITLINQWDLPSGIFSVTDYTPQGLSFVSTDVAHSDQWANTILAISNIAPGDERDVRVTYVIDSDFPGWAISNYAEISSDNGNDIDSNPDQNMDNDCLQDDAIDKQGCA